MFRLLAPFVAGIWLGEVCFSERLLPAWLFEGPVLLIGCLFLLSFSHLLLPVFRGAFLCCALLLMGLIFQQTNRALPSDHWSHHYLRSDLLVGKILEQQQKTNHTQVILKVEQVLSADYCSRPASGKLLLLFSHKKEKPELPPDGSLIAFAGDPRRIPGAMNPKAFDAAAYWKRKKVFHQIWIMSGQWLELRSTENWLTLLRNRTLRELKKVLRREEGLGIAAALVLGDKSLLDKHVKAAYSESGAIHVLAVSGLHVGLVYALFNWLVQAGIGLIPALRKAKLPFLLTCLIAYALFTGASSSVCRSVLMLSCWIIGKSLNKTLSVFNTISAAAFLLLIIDTDMLFDVGFQLSFSAVLGIIGLYRMILKCWTPRWKILNYAWKLWCVSVAAQLGTLPLSLYYFHQFPLYFGFSSLMIVPLITGVLMLTFAVLAFFWQPVVQNLLAVLLDHLIQLCNQIATGIQGLPHAVIKDIWVEKMEVVLYYLLLVSLVQWIRNHTHSWVLLTVLVLSVFVMYYWYEEGKLKKNAQMVWYHSPSFLMMDWYESGRVTTLMGEGAPVRTASFISHSWRSFLKAEEADTLVFPAVVERSDTATVWTLSSEKLVVVGPQARHMPTGHARGDPAVLIVDPRNPFAVHWVREEEVKQLILLNRRPAASGWIELAAARNIPCWNIEKQGAFRLEFKTLRTPRR